MPSCDQVTNIGIKHLEVSDNLTLGRKVAFGGYSDLYEGYLEQGGSSIKVAIKELRILTHIQEDRFQKHFLREVNIWKELNHPNIVPLLGYSIRPESGPRFISPWYENGNLQQYLLLHPTVNRLQLLADVLDGMRYLESHDVVHGDLKSLNIVIDNDGHARLCDFGTARFLGVVTGFTTSNQDSAVTRRYLSPERLLVDQPPTTASDIWAFGCIVIEVIALQRPYGHLNKDHLVNKAIEKGKSPLGSNYNKSNAPGRLFWKFIERCWIVDPNDRPNIDQLIDHIGGFLVDDVHNQAEIKNTGFKFNWSAIRKAATVRIRQRPQKIESNPSQSRLFCISFGGDSS